ncbi:SpaH/EbpB family LPXTG-anchored major pilin [Tessaracoccus coleopterorum]|uniref:SpaH/EbpB family LPXTG-anchored major pilin n=1 Tax=Tessaracoccus coleopterorum TaxID=2714950 RepID=UPI0022B237A1|nr:SpaH/EbpB family LPXTG-anchored major pilin [Tessaracoccus coleopterorum]
MGGELTVDLTTTVDEVGDGSIPNDDYSSEFNGTTVPGVPTPYTYWGQLSILKTDDSENPLPLKGAEFQVFNTVAGECSADAPAAGALAVGTSDAEGIVQWADVDPSDVLGLWIANTDGPADPLPTRDVCVYETVVPAGHTAGAFEALQTIEVGTEATNELTVVNPRKTDRPDLPLTGGAGTLVMSFGGLALVGLGLVALLASRRRKAAL